MSADKRRAREAAGRPLQARPPEGSRGTGADGTYSSLLIQLSFESSSQPWLSSLS